MRGQHKAETDYTREDALRDVCRRFCVPDAHDDACIALRQDGGVQWLRSRPKTAKAAPIYGMCLSCRSVEVALNEVIGTRDFSNIGEAAEYPVGYGCEVCA